MERLVKGDVVVVPFPFSNLADSKRRPALVISVLEGDDVILCQITSQAIEDSCSISIREDDFEKGGLRRPSNVRPNRLFTADSHIVLYKAGKLRQDKLNEIIERVVKIVRG